MPIRKNYAGVTLGRIVGIEDMGRNKHGSILWSWRCECGAVFTSKATNKIKQGRGCCKVCEIKERREMSISSRPEYRVWHGIKNRCLLKTCPQYKYYGGAGIGLHEEWANDFNAFYRDVGKRPCGDKRYTLDRVDNNRGYEPGNVRWVTYDKQARNKGQYGTNTSGITGVHLTQAWVATWNDMETMKTNSKSFSVNKYGNELAFKLACEWRERMISEMNEKGAGYSAEHGIQKEKT